MFAECLVIFGIMLAITVVFLKTKKEYASCTIPLWIVPGFGIIGHLISDFIAKHTAFDYFLSYMLIILIGVIISTLMLGYLCNKIHYGKYKFIYVTMSGLFNVIFSIILLYNTYNYK